MGVEMRGLAGSIYKRRVHLVGADDVALCGYGGAVLRAQALRDLDISEWRDLCNVCFEVHIERLQASYGTYSQRSNLFCGERELRNRFSALDF